MIKKIALLLLLFISTQTVIAAGGTPPPPAPPPPPGANIDGYLFVLACMALILAYTFYNPKNKTINT